MPDVADYVLERLTQWGIHRIYGYPGDGINGFLSALERADGDPELIQSRHEEMAAFMACGHAKFTGEVGCCLATSGPGAIHLLNGLYDAKLDHQPVVAIIGQQKTLSLGAHYQQEVDLQTLFKDVSEYVQYCMNPAQARHLVDRAVKVALTTRGVSTLIFPNDIQEAPAEPSPPRVHGAVYSSVGWNKPRIIPPDSELRRAADILNGSSRVAILIGQGAAGATDEVIEAADRLGAGVAKALLGRDAVPDDLPFVTGPIGLLGSRPSYDMVMGCDALFMIGTSFPYAEWLPPEGQAKGVEIDIDGRMIGIRYPMDVHLVGDSKDTLQALVPLLERKTDRSWREEIEGNITQWWKVLEDRAMMDGDPMNPQRVAHELSSRLPERCIITADSGSATTWWARHLRLRRGMKASLSGTLATMGPGVPYAIGAKFAYPDRPVIAMVGDGAFQMNGMNEMITVKRYWERWSNPTLIFCVFNNGDLNQVSWEQRAMAGSPRFPTSQALPDVPYAEYAALLGLKGIRCEKGEEMGAAWDEALAARRPVVLEVVVDDEIPPLPPKIRKSEAKQLMLALAKGDTERAGVIEKGFLQKFYEFKEALSSSED